MSKIIIALDFNAPQKALDFARLIRMETDWVKVGPELFICSGPDIIFSLKQTGFNVFLDLKLFDIPNTVSKAVSRCVDIGADMITMHTLGGENMIKAAVNARDQAARKSSKAILLGVTLLTSMNKEDLPWKEQRNTDRIVCSLALKAHDFGLDGCVCSGLETEMIRKTISRDFCLITPGIRTDNVTDDQKRVVTPEQAQRAGADYLVVGRPVTESADPVQALRDIRNRLA